MIKMLTVSVGIIIAVSAGSLTAQEKESSSSKWYMGAQLGTLEVESGKGLFGHPATVSIADYYNYEGVKIEDGDSLSIQLGYRLFPGFALEAAYDKLGDAEGDISFYNPNLNAAGAGTATADVDGFRLSGILSARVLEDDGFALEPFLRLGVYMYDYEISTIHTIDLGQGPQLDTFSKSDSGSSFTYGIGARLGDPDRFAWILSYDWYDIDGADYTVGSFGILFAL